MNTSLFERLSIRQRMTYLVLSVTAAVVFAAVFVFFALSKIESDYTQLQQNATAGALYTLEIEKDLNYVSRTSRDIMLGNSYDKNMVKLQERSEKIKKNFAELEKLADSESESLIAEAKRTTFAFLDNTMALMQTLGKMDKTLIAELEQNYGNPPYLRQRKIPTRYFLGCEHCGQRSGHCSQQSAAGACPFSG